MATSWSTSQFLPGSVNIRPAEFPPAIVSTDFNPETVAKDFVANFNEKLKSSDLDGLIALFSKDGYWRDHLVLSWRFRTVRGQDELKKFLTTSSAGKQGLTLKSIALDFSSPIRQPQKSAMDAEGKATCVMFYFAIETAIGNGTGVARLVEESPNNWKIFTLYTSLRELSGHEENVYRRRPRGVELGEDRASKNWAERRVDETKYSENREPTVLILGAGQAGLTIAARLKALGVDALIIDKNERVGDNWRQRYRHLVLHDPIWYDHLPYVRFPPQWPIFTPKDKLGDFFEAYVSILELNVWNKCNITSSSFDTQKHEWTITVKRQGKDGKEETRTLHPRHFVQATGHSGKMNMPDIKGMDTFKGDVICHSSRFPGARQGAGKKAVVIGSCNSAHDIAHDFFDNGYDVTMVQRSSTSIVSTDSIINIGLKGLYEEGGPDVEDADLVFYSIPAPLFKAAQIGVTKIQSANDVEIISGLERTGFKIDKGPDDAGFFCKYFQRGGGYYIDVGTSKLITEGKIKLKQGQEIEEILPRGVKFADGVELEADEIVLATGYQNMRSITREVLGDKVADSVGDIWGFNEEGEMRTIWQQSGHPGFWFHGGNLALCRYYSRLLALQIKGFEEGLYTYDD